MMTPAAIITPVEEAGRVNAVPVAEVGACGWLVLAIQKKSFRSERTWLRTATPPCILTSCGMKTPGQPVIA
jgi:hypothetical protein